MSQKLEYELKGKSDVEQVTGRAKKSVETLGQSFKQAGSSIIKNLAGMFGAAVLFNKAMNLISGTFKELGEVADQVDRSGLSAEQFQKLAYAAQQSGVSVSALAKATRQLRIDMAEAAAGTGKKVEMFQALGISMDQLKSGDASAVFLAISKAMAGSADDSERLLISTAFFGDKIGNDILPLLNDYLKLSKDIANAPIVDAKTLKLIGDYNDGMDSITAKMKVFVAYIFSAYDAYSKFISKIAETVATFGFDIADKVLPRGTAAAAASAGIKYNPLTGPLLALGADGSVKAKAASAPANSGAAAKALLAAIGGAPKVEKEKAADSKSSNASSVSGNVIGVGQNPVITALQEQQAIARQQLAYLQIIAAYMVTTNASGDLTASGATPRTPANAAMNRSPIVTKSK
jgi:hypothetical protein